MSDLTGKTALVTGSTSGIGKAIAETFASQGANVILNGRRPASEVRAQQRELEKTCDVCTLYCRTDMANPRDIEKMFKQAAELFGGVDILVNNAGSQHVAPVKDFSLEAWNSIMSVHLTASFLSIKSALPHMEEQGWGRIINIGSAHAKTASPFKSAYTAAKHGMLGLSKVVALETAEMGITCNTICPGYVWTPLVEGQIAKQAETRGLHADQVVMEVFMDVHPTRRFTTVQQIADTAVFLCSPAADNITGTEISMDGGWVSGRVPRRHAPKHQP